MSDKITEELTGLRTQAPPTLMPAVLLETGVADGFAAIVTPAGPAFLAFNKRGVSACEFGSDVKAFSASFESRFGRTAVPVDHLPNRLAGGVERVMASGKLGSLPVDLSSVSEFAQAVLRQTSKIPKGEVRPYGWVAREIGKPGATRAVGSALNRNPVPVLVPCHRVVPSSGALGQYAFGPEAKRALLEAEGLDTEWMGDAAERGVRFTGSATTHIYCLPTCHAARRTMDKHQQEFASAGKAAAAGYRPCKLCRPKAA